MRLHPLQNGLFAAINDSKNEEETLEKLNRILPKICELRGYSRSILDELKGIIPVSDLESSHFLSLDCEGMDSAHTLTPLRAAVKKNYLQCVKKLIEYKANVNYQCSSIGKTALMECTEQKQEQIVKLLLKEKADPNLVTDWNGICDSDSDSKQSALLYLAKNGCDSSVSLLLESKADVNYETPAGGYSALFLAAEKGHLSSVRLLLQAGANPNSCYKKYISSVGNAANHAQFSCVDLLLKAKAKIDDMDFDMIVDRHDYVSRPTCSLPALSLLLDNGLSIWQHNITEVMTEKKISPEFNFCRGMWYEQNNELTKAIKFYLKKPQYHGSHLRYGIRVEQEQKFDVAANQYMQAMLKGNPNGASYLVSLSQKCEQDMGAFIDEHIASIPYFSSLTADQWLFVVIKLLAVQKTVENTYFALAASRKAEKLAKSDKEKTEAKESTKTCWNFFHRVTNRGLDPAIRENNLNILAQSSIRIAGQESAEIIADYLNAGWDDVLKTEISAAFSP